MPVHSAGDPVTPSNVLAFPQPTSVGSARVGVVQTGQGISFVQRAGRKVQTLEYDDVTSGLVYSTSEVSLYANHLTRAGVKELAWQQEPWRVLWAVMNDGTLRGCTIMTTQDVLAWHQHTIGGTGVAVESVTSIPASGYSELWLAVKRTVGGATVRFVERMSEDFVVGGSVVQSGAYFVDAGLSYSGTPATTLSGLTHLEGQTVQVLADGAAHPDRVVSGGAITLDRAASVVHAGLGYTSRLETLDLNYGAQDGTSLTRRRSIHSVGVLLYQTLGGFMGWRDGSTYSLEEIQYREASMAMDSPPSLFTGQRVVDVPSRWAQQCNLVVVQTQPLPMTVAGLAPRLQANE